MIVNDEVWYDSAGREIRAQGGCVTRVGDAWYWVGAEFNDARADFVGINLYRSTDLMHWSFVRRVLTPADSGDLVTSAWVGRPDLVHNAATGRYVLVFEISGAPGIPGPGNHIGFASSSTVDGDYTYHGRTLVDGATVGDHSVFVDTDGSAYLVFVGDAATTRNDHLKIAPLAPDYLSVSGSIFAEPNTARREAPHIVRIGPTYHWFASGMYWWASTSTMFRSSDSLTAWGPWTTVATCPPSTDSFNTQFDMVLPVEGSRGTSYLYVGDRYTNFQGCGVAAPTGIGRNAWYVLTFDGGTPTLHGYPRFTVDTATGQVTVPVDGGDPAAASG